MVVTKKFIIFILFMFLFILFFTACSNSLLNQWLNVPPTGEQKAPVPLTDEQKIPDYAIQQYLNNNEYSKGFKYLTLGNYLFVDTTEKCYTGYRTNDGSYSFKLPINVTQIPTFMDNQKEFFTQTEILYIDNQYNISISVVLQDQALENDYNYSVYDNTGDSFSLLQLESDDPVWWLKVMDNIPDNYKIYLEMNGTKYEILNKQTIEQKLK